MCTRTSLPKAMSVVGYTPPAGSTPSTSSGSTNPSAPVQKAPRLVAGSSVTSKIGRTSTAQLVHDLRVEASPATPREGGEPAAHDDSPEGSQAASSSSLSGSQVPRRGGGDRGRPQSPERVQVHPQPKMENATDCTTGTSFSTMAGDPSTPVVRTVRDLTKGSAQGERVSGAKEEHGGLG